MTDTLTFFKKAISKKRLSHLYLLSGENESYSKELVFSIVFEILKLEKSSNSEQLMTQINNRMHPNLFFIEPESDSIKKEQIIALQKEFSKTSLVGKSKVYIISEVDRLTSSAANSLLKFLEEPLADDIYGFLLTERKDAVLETIVSRSQVVLVDTAISEVDSLLEQYNLSEKKKELLWSLTKDQKELIYLAEDVNMERMLNVFNGFIESLKDSKKSIYLHASENFSVTSVNKDWFRYYLTLMMLFFIDLLNFKKELSVKFKTFLDDIRLIANFFRINDLLAIIESVKDALSKERYYVNSDLLTASIMIEIEKRIRR